MKILFVLEYYLPHLGGVENVFMNLCERLVEKGHKVKIITSRLPDTYKKEIINGVKVERINVPKFMSRYFFPFFSIPKVIKDAKKYDLIHSTTFTAAIPASIASKLTKKKSILTVHEIWINKWNKFTNKGKLSNFIHNILEKLIYKFKFNKYVTVSNATKKELSKIIPEKKILTIHNGHDYKHWDPKKYDGDNIKKGLKLKNNFIYFGYGRPGTSKGFDNLIKAVPKIKEKIPNSKLVLMLSNDITYKKERDELLKLIKKLKIDDNVLILNSVRYNLLPNYIKMADIVVIPSRTEGFGYTCVESCSMNKVVVASNIASLPEVINGKGKLVNVSPEGISKGVIDCYNKKYNTFPNKTFKWEDNVKKHEELYEKLLKNNNHDKYKNN